MEDMKLFIRFLKSVQKNFKDERRIEFYAGELGIGPEDLTRIIKESSDSSLPEWIEVMEKSETGSPIARFPDNE